MIYNFLPLLLKLEFAANLQLRNIFTNFIMFISFSEINIWE